MQLGNIIIINGSAIQCKIHASDKQIDRLSLICFLKSKIKLLLNVYTNDHGHRVHQNPNT